MMEVWSGTCVDGQRGWIFGWNVGPRVDNARWVVPVPCSGSKDTGESAGSGLGFVFIFESPPMFYQGIAHRVLQNRFINLCPCPCTRGRYCTHRLPQFIFRPSRCPAVTGPPSVGSLRCSNIYPSQSSLLLMHSDDGEVMGSLGLNG
jgi:hypothetical protein